MVLRDIPKLMDEEIREKLKTDYKTVSLDLEARA